MEGESPGTSMGYLGGEKFTIGHNIGVVFATGFHMEEGQSWGEEI